MAIQIVRGRLSPVEGFEKEEFLEAPTIDEAVGFEISETVAKGGLTLRANVPPSWPVGKEALFMIGPYENASFAARVYVDENHQIVRFLQPEYALRLLNQEVWFAYGPSDELILSEQSFYAIAVDTYKIDIAEAERQGYVNRIPADAVLKGLNLSLRFSGARREGDVVSIYLSGLGTAPAFVRHIVLDSDNLRKGVVLPVPSQFILPHMGGFLTAFYVVNALGVEIQGPSGIFLLGRTPGLQTIGPKLDNYGNIRGVDTSLQIKAPEYLDKREGDLLTLCLYHDVFIYDTRNYSIYRQQVASPGVGWDILFDVPLATMIPESICLATIILERQQGEPLLVSEQIVYLPPFGQRDKEGLTRRVVGNNRCDQV
ncbi:hypothetical protein [Pseudomonas sp. TE3610]